MGDVLVFARAGRSNAEGAFATCHCLTLPPSEPGYYFWRDRIDAAAHAPLGMVRHQVAGRDDRHRATIKYMISFALPRFCDQSLDRSRKERFYPGAEPWVAKLDTVVHELYHIDPELAGIRRIEREDGTYSANCHGQQFFEQVADMVHDVSGQQPDPGRLRLPAPRLRDARRAPRRRRRHQLPHVPVVSRSATSSALAEQPPCESDAAGVEGRTAARAAAADALHRGRSARPPVHGETRRAG